MQMELFRYLSSGEKDCIGILIRMRTDTGKDDFSLNQLNQQRRVIYHDESDNTGWICVRNLCSRLFVMQSKPDFQPGQWLMSLSVAPQFTDREEHLLEVCTVCGALGKKNKKTWHWYSITVLWYEYHKQKKPRRARCMIHTAHHYFS